MKGQGSGIIDKAPVTTDPDHRMHYDFCGDLGIKKIYQQAFTSYQPKFALYKAVNLGVRNIKFFEKDGMRIPMDVRLTKV
jgi:hypothetical protein